MEADKTAHAEKRIARYTSYREFCDYYYKSNHEQDAAEKKQEASFGSMLAKEAFRKDG